MVAHAQSPLGDEFDASSSLADWTQVATSSATTLDIDTTVGGELVIEPGQSSWFNANQAPFLAKTGTGNFAVQALVRARKASNPSLPLDSGFAYVGLLARDPASPPESWVYVASGYSSGNHDVRAGNTIGSVSTLNTTAVSAGDLELVLCRVGTTLSTFYRTPGGTWSSFTTYSRPDLPGTLQLGPMAFDFTGTSDFRAQVDYVRFGVPQSSAECLSAADTTDTDGDGLTDAEEIQLYGTDPLLPDTDDDGLSDFDEVIVHGTDPLLDADGDSDGILDVVEVARGMNPTLADTDGDSVDDDVDNCPSAYNPKQEDQAGLASSAPDGVGDLCQNGDFNGDGEVDALDITLQRRGLIGLEPALDPALPPSAP